MAAIRRRRPKDEDMLTESLLDDSQVQHEASSDDDDHGHGHHHAQQPGGSSNQQRALIVYPGEFNLPVFVQSVLDWWNRLFGQLVSYALNLWPQQRVEELSLLQTDRLLSLRERVAVRFDLANTEHQDSLRRLWSLSFAGEPCDLLKTPRWKDMGWQGEDPATDFRGAGLYGLDNLIYLAEVHPETYRRLLDKADGVRAQWEYPFAVAGLNITYTLSELLELHTPATANRETPPRTAAGRAFLLLMRDSDVAFEELYCATFCLLDTTWLEMRASYMEFNTVLKRVKAEVESALASRPADLRALRGRLLG